MQVKRKDYARLYNLLLSLPNITIKKNVGTQINEVLVSRSWTSKDITKFNRNRRILKEAAIPMLEVEENSNKQLMELKSQLEKSAAGQEKLSDTQLNDIKNQVDKIRVDTIDYFDEYIELPDMEQIDEADIAGWEFTGSEMISYFWEYLVKYKE